MLTSSFSTYYASFTCSYLSISLLSIQCLIRYNYVGCSPHNHHTFNQDHGFLDDNMLLCLLFYRSFLSLIMICNLLSTIHLYIHHQMMIRVITKSVIAGLYYINKKKYTNYIILQQSKSIIYYLFRLHTFFKQNCVRCVVPL